MVVLSASVNTSEYLIREVELAQAPDTQEGGPGIVSEPLGTSARRSAGPPQRTARLGGRIELGANIVAPFAGGPEFTCVVKPGTRIFVAAYSAECSTVEGPPFHGDNEDELRTCAKANVAEFEPVTATLDGKPIALAEVQTALLNFVLPAGNVFGLPAGTTGQSVGDGWVALLHPLPPGSHTIQIFTNDNPNPAATTTITVQPGA